MGRRPASMAHGGVLLHQSAPLGYPQGSRKRKAAAWMGQSCITVLHFCVESSRQPFLRAGYWFRVLKLRS